MQVLVILLLLLCSCGRHSAEQQQLAAVFHKIETSEAERGWRLANYMGILQGETIKRLHASFNVERAPTVDEAREMLVQGVADVLNTSEFSHLTADDLKYSLAFKQPDGRFVMDGAIAHVFLFSGVVYYSIFNENRHGLEVLSQEPFLDARSCVGSPSAASRAAEFIEKPR